MPSLVEQLQRDALDRNVSVATLLRKAKVVAVKLSLSDAIEWIDLELSGYPDLDKVPGYRKVEGQPKGQNPIRGWIPIMVEDDAELLAIISSQEFQNSVSEL